MILYSAERGGPRQRLSDAAKVSPAQRAELPARRQTASAYRRVLLEAHAMQREDPHARSAQAGMLEALSQGLISNHNRDAQEWARAMAADREHIRKALFIKAWMEAEEQAPLGAALVLITNTPIGTQVYERTVHVRELLVTSRSKEEWKPGRCFAGVTGGGLCQKPRINGEWNCAVHDICYAPTSSGTCKEKRVSGGDGCKKHVTMTSGVWTRLGERWLREATVIERPQWNRNGHPRRIPIAFGGVSEEESVTLAHLDPARDERERQTSPRLPGGGELLPDHVVVIGEKPFIGTYEQYAALLNGETVQLPGQMVAGIEFETEARLDIPHDARRLLRQAARAAAPPLAGDLVAALGSFTARRIRYALDSVYAVVRRSEFFRLLTAGFDD